ncbi:hypothetical protein FJY93_00905 [Candidatus Kaiserbacteria bacterium]|nr:hypothetical protein [Candidatus Kaiserbacteria bacterium]
MLEKQHSLASNIIRSLAERPEQSVVQLRDSISAAGGKQYSLQGFYKELKKLQKEGVVFKVSGMYGLRLPWVLDSLALAQTLEKKYVERPQLPTILPDEHKREIWHFSDLLKMNDFWSHILLILIQQSEKKVLLGWNPHPWFHLVQTKQEKQYIKSLKLAKSKLYLIVGGNTFLDRWTQKFWDKDTVVYSFGKSPFEADRATYINVVDDYVLTVKVDPQIARRIDDMYARTKSMDDLDLHAVLSIFQQKTKAHVWLEKNPGKAKKIKGKFKKYWGVDFD